MNKRLLLNASLMACLGLSPVLSPVNAADEGQVDHSTMDHSQHSSGSADQGMDHSQHSMERDELGRSGFNMKHQMDEKMMKELREKIALFRPYTDAQIAMSMDMMGPEYAWYISPPELKGTQGVLILMHGFREQGDKVFRDRMQPIGNIFPTSLGIGMAMMMSSNLQVALDDIKAAGAKEVVVVPVTSSATNELYRQWLYIFGLQEEAEFASVPRVKTDMVVKFAKPPGDDPLVGEILLDHALEISTDPSKEVVVIAGHGPSGDEDNQKELKVLAGLAKIVKQDGGFADVRGMTLQDDAPAPIREANVKKMREFVEGAVKDGKKVLVVTNLIGARTVQAKLRSDLKGLDFTFNAKGIVQHDNFMKWMGEAIRHELETTAAN